MADQVFSGEVVAISPTANNLTSGWDFDATSRYVEKGSSFVDGEKTDFGADGSTAPKVSFENFVMYYTNGSTSSDAWNYADDGITQFRVTSPNYDDYAVTFKQGQMTYEFTDSNNDKGSGNTWSEGQVFRYDGTAPANPLEGLLRKDYDFEDLVFLNRQNAPESAFGGNALDERFRLTRCTLDFRNENTNSGVIGVPFFGSNCIMDEVKIIKADDAYGDSAVFISNPGEVSGLTVDGGFLKNEHSAGGIYSGVSFQGAGTNGVLNFPAQYYQRGNDNTDGGRSDRMMRLIDCELDESKAFVSGRAGFMIYRSLTIQPFIYDTSASPDNTGVHVHVLRKGSGSDNYTEFIETYDDMDITVASATVGSTTKSYIVGQSDNDSYSTVGDIESAWVDVGNPYFAGDRLRISEAHSSINGVHNLPDTYYGAIFLDPDFTATNGNYENAKFEILPPVSVADGTFNSFRVPIVRVLGKLDTNDNYTTEALFNANNNAASGRTLEAAISVADDSDDDNAANWSTDLYYNERDIRVTVVPPYPYEIVNTDFDDIAYELTKDEAGSGLTVVPGVTELPGIVEKSASTIAARDNSSTLVEMVEMLFAFGREISSGERSNVLSESGTLRRDKDFISIDGSTITFNCEDVEFTTSDAGGSGDFADLVKYDTSNSDNGKLTIKVPSAGLTIDGGLDAINVSGTITNASNLDGVSYKDENGVGVTINCPSSVTECRWKGQYYDPSATEPGGIVYDVDTTTASLTSDDIRIYSTVANGTFSPSGDPGTDGTQATDGAAWSTVAGFTLPNASNRVPNSSTKLLMFVDTSNWALFTLGSRNNSGNSFSTWNATLDDSMGVVSNANGDDYKLQAVSSGNPANYNEWTDLSDGYVTETDGVISFVTTASTDLQVAVAPKGQEARLLKFNSGAFGTSETPAFNAYETPISDTEPDYITGNTDVFTITWHEDSSFKSESNVDYLEVNQNAANSALDTALNSAQVGNLNWAMQREEGYLDMLLTRSQTGEAVTIGSGNKWEFPFRLQLSKADTVALDTDLSVPVYTTVGGSSADTFLDSPKNGNTDKAKWAIFQNNNSPAFDSAAVEIAATNAINDSTVISGIETDVAAARSAAEGAEALSA